VAEMNPVSKFSGYQLEWQDEDGFLLSKKYSLYYAADPGSNPLKIASVPCGFFVLLLAQFRIFRRLFRITFNNVIKIDSNRILITFRKGIWLLANKKILPVEGMQTSCRFFRGGCALDRSGNVYLGEYYSNPGREKLRIYRLPAGTTKLEIAYEMDAGSARHIHGVFSDPFDTGAIWVTTGDIDDECKIMRTYDDFKTVETIGEGDETWRSVSLGFTRNAIYYGMDAEFEQNYLYRLDRETLERTRLNKVDGPVYYSFFHRNSHWFVTTAEKCPSQQVNRASLYKLSENEEVTRIFSLDKDFLPNSFMFGSLHFPIKLSNDQPLFISCVGLKGYDGKVISI